jgi:hypothetical protein
MNEMPDKTNVTCAYCRTRVSGIPDEQNPDVLMSFYELVRSGKNTRVVKAIRKAGRWLCFGDQDKMPLDVVVGSLVVTAEHRDTHIASVITQVTELRDHGAFKIKDSLYNVFGVRVRGVGVHTIFRVASLQDIKAVQNAAAVAGFTERDREQAADRRRERNKKVLAAFIDMLPEAFKDCHADISEWGPNSYSINILITPAIVGVEPVRES